LTQSQVDHGGDGKTAFGGETHSGLLRWVYIQSLTTPRQFPTKQLKYKPIPIKTLGL
jgi:hypothetical protein